MSDFDLQGLVQVGISTDRPAHKNIIHEAVGEIALLRVEVERLQGRCGELESNIQQFVCFGTGPVADAENKFLSAVILRKQAEAVESARDEICNKTDPPSWRSAELTDYAQRLRQQADELEEASSGQ